MARRKVFLQLLQDYPRIMSIIFLTCKYFSVLRQRQHFTGHYLASVVFSSKKINESKVLRSTPEGGTLCLSQKPLLQCILLASKYERNPKEVHVCWGMYAHFSFCFCLVLIWRQTSISWKVFRGGEPVLYMFVLALLDILSKKHQTWSLANISYVQIENSPSAHLKISDSNA